MRCTDLFKEESVQAAVLPESKPRLAEARVFAQTMGVNLSKRGEYALRVLLDLTMARHLGVQLVPLAVLAEAQNIPVTFLEQILHSLRQAGHLSSTRGKRGGYSLSASALNTPVGDFVRFFDGPLAPISCASSTAYKRCSCPDEARCGIRHLMLEARNALSTVLDGVTLAQLAERTLEQYENLNALPSIMERLEQATASTGRRRKAGDPGEPEYLI